VIVGLAIQVAFAALVLRWSAGRDTLDFFAGQVEALIDYTTAGVEFLFGDLAADSQPERRGDVAQLGLKALLAGSLVSLANASIAGVLAA
jgi:nucleoside permease NupC